MQRSCIRPCKQRRKRRGSYSEIRFTAPDVLMLYCVLSICCRWRKSSATRKTKDILRLSEQEQALPGNLSSATSKLGIQASFSSLLFLPFAAGLALRVLVSLAQKFLPLR